MNEYRKVLVLLLVAAVVAIGFGCSSTEQDKETTDAKSIDEPVTDSAQILAMFHEVTYRLKHGDKSAMFENEFFYMQDAKTFDEYLAEPSVRWAQADSVLAIEVLGVQFYRPDSAVVQTRIKVDRPDDQRQFETMPLTVYWQDGRWIKPTASVFSEELKYRDQIRQADSAAAAEAEEG